MKHHHPSNKNFRQQSPSKHLSPPANGHKTWHCVSGCGACCYLQPTDRDDLEDYLTAAQLELYLSLVGEDGWCIHYDRQQRSCKIYADRPEFCRVTVATFQEMFGIEADELPEFAVACCREHIADIYGQDSLEMQQFNQEVST